MDRNRLGICHYRDDVVALRKESVDRNIMSAFDVLAVSASLSARRAWIEIKIWYCGTSIGLTSLSARRAWIEIRGG